MDISFKIKGMVCEGCENRVKKAIGNIEGVESVSADFNTGKVMVIANNNISKESIKEIIEDIGFEVE